MRNKIFILVVLFCNVLFTDTKGQVIIRLVFNCENGGHGILMHYILKDIKELDSIDFANDSIDDFFLSKMFKLPLVNTKGALENCISSDTMNINFNELFSEKFVYRFERNEKKYKIEISILAAKLDYCTFPLYIRYWTTCDAYFKKAAVIISKPVVQIISQSDKKIIDRFKAKLNQANIFCNIE